MEQPFLFIPAISFLYVPFLFVPLVSRMVTSQTLSFKAKRELIKYFAVVEILPSIGGICVFLFPLANFSW